MKTLQQEHEEWRARMRAITQQLRDNPHRRERDSGRDGHFRHNMFIEGIPAKTVDKVFK